MVERRFERTLIVQPATEQILSPSERGGTLTVLAGSGMGAMIALNAPRTVIGRSEDADFRIEGGGVSRTHACVWQADQEFEIEDLGSSNGTFLEHGRVTGRARLRDGARIGIGSYVLRFALQDKLEQAASMRLYQLSVRDGLTGLYNRRHFDERLCSELAFSVRHGSALALILIDIDHFKQINDRHGHQAGDAVLQHLGETLQAGVRTEDVVTRYGGEEFAVVARGIDVSGAQAFAERLRALIARTRVSYEGQDISITVSLGIGHNQWCGLAAKAVDLIAAADQALYAAKRAGRDRVVTASSPISYAESTATGGPQRARRLRSWDQPTAPTTTKAPRE